MKRAALYDVSEILDTLRSDVSALANSEDDPISLGARGVSFKGHIGTRVVGVSMERVRAFESVAGGEADISGLNSRYER